MKYNLRKGLFLLMAILCVGWVQAETKSVSTLADLRDAIGNSEITTITLGGNIKVTDGTAITINRALTLDGKDYTISGSVTDGALLNITGTGKVTIQNLTVANTPEDGGSEIYVRGSEEDGSSPIVASFQNIKLDETSEMGIAAECHATISIENVQETSSHQYGIFLAGATSAAKASLTIEGTNNTFDKCLMPICIYYNEDDTNSFEVNPGESRYVVLPGSENAAWTDRYNSTDKSYKITLQDRDQKVVLMELQLIADLAENGSDINKLIFGAGTLDLNAWSEDGIFSINSSLTIEGAGSGENGTIIKTTNDNHAFLISGENINVTLKNLAVQGDKDATLVEGKMNSAAIAFPNEHKYAGTLTLENVKISQYFFGINCGGVVTTSTPMSRINISNSTFEKCYHKAIYTENSEVSISGSHFIDCATKTKQTSGWFTTVAVDINLKYGNYDSASITNCTFTNNGVASVVPPTENFPNAIAYSTALAVKARNDGSYKTNPATLASATITGNKFTKNSVAIQLGEPQNNKTNVITSITLSDNEYVDNHNNVINSSTCTTVPSEVQNVKGLTDALAYAVSGATIKLAAGDYDIVPTTRNDTYGNYLPIIQNGITIVGPEDKETIAKIYTSTGRVNGVWADQNLITIHGDGVTLKNLTLVCKKEVNKVIESLGKDLTLSNLIINEPSGENFAGSIYFNTPEDDTEKNIGDVTLSNLHLNKGRITFSGAQKGTVKLSNVTVDYRDVQITGTSMEDLQLYSPIGNIKDKNDLTFNVKKLNVILNNATDCYQLDETTIANLPANTMVNLAAGEYAGLTSIDKEGITITGTLNTEETGNAKITSPITVNANNVTLEELEFATTSTPAVTIADNVTETKISHNYWGDATPNFYQLVSGEADPYPYYKDAAMTQLAYKDAVITTDETWSEAYEGRHVTIKNGGKLTLEVAMTLGTVTIEEGGQLVPAATEGEMKATTFVFVPTLEATKWKALGTPFTSSVLMDSNSKTPTLADANDDEGIWFASLKDDNQPEIVVKNRYSTAGLWASTEPTTYRLKADEVTFVDAQEPTSTDGLKMVVNPNTYNITLKQSAYVLNDAGTVFELKDTPTIKAFQSFVIADDNTKATLRSIGTTDPNATGNEFVVKEGYYLTTERGAIVVHTAEPMELYVVAVSGAVVYRGTVADGQRIAVPTGFYAVNGQMVRVK